MVKVMVSWMGLNVAAETANRGTQQVDRPALARRVLMRSAGQHTGAGPVSSLQVDVT